MNFRRFSCSWQTGKSARVPCILMHAPFWRGLLHVDARAARRGEDDQPSRHGDGPGHRRPERVVEAIFKHYEHRSFHRALPSAKSCSTSSKGDALRARLPFATPREHDSSARLPA